MKLGVCYTVLTGLKYYTKLYLDGPMKDPDSNLSWQLSPVPLKVTFLDHHFQNPATRMAPTDQGGTHIPSTPFYL